MKNAKIAKTNAKRAEAKRIIKDLRRRGCPDNLVYSVEKVRLTVLRDNITDENGQVLITAEELDELEKAGAEKWVEYYFDLLKAGCTIYEPEYMLACMMEYDQLSGKKLSPAKIRLAEGYAARNVAIVKAQDKLDKIIKRKNEFASNVHGLVDELLMYMKRYKLSYSRLETPEEKRVTAFGAYLIFMR